MRREVCLLTWAVAISSTLGALSSTDDSPFIIGGVKAAPGSWPWQAVLLYNNRFICGAVLVGPKTVLTAAHCVDGGRASNFKVLLGEHSFDDVEGYEQVINVASFRKNRLWNSQLILNDIAFINLENAYTASSWVSEIPLVTESSIYDGNSECYITGYGYTRVEVAVIDGSWRVVSADRPDVLMQAEIDVISDTECAQFFGGFDRTQVCVYEASNNKSSCYGDSGGPLVCRENGEFVLVGLTSYGWIDCSGPSVYTEVKHYLSWIAREQQRADRRNGWKNRTTTTKKDKNPRGAKNQSSSPRNSSVN